MLLVSMSSIEKYNATLLDFVLKLLVLVQVAILSWYCSTVSQLLAILAFKCPFLLLFWLLWESLQFCPSFFVLFFFFSLLRLHCQLFHAADRSRCHLGFSCASNKKLRGEEIGSFYPLQCTFLLEEMRGRAISPLCKFDFTNRRVGMDWVIGKDSSK